MPGNGLVRIFNSTGNAFIGKLYRFDDFGVKREVGVEIDLKPVTQDSVSVVMVA